MKTVKLTVILLALLLAAMAMVPMVSAQQETHNNEVREIQLIKQLDKQVIDYNQAVIERNLQKIKESVKKIDSTLEKLSEIGYIADFSSASQMMKGQKNQGIPTTVTFDVKEKSQNEMNNGHSFTANEAQLKIYNELDVENISTGEFLEKV